MVSDSMEFDLKKVLVIAENVRQVLLQIKILNFAFFVVIISGISIYFAFPLNELFVSFNALILPGYLFYRLIIKNSELIETFLFSVILSMGVIVFSTFILTSSMNFTLSKETITSAAVFSNVIFIGIHYLKGVLNE